MRILNYGSLNMDYVYRVDHIAAPGETIRSFDFQVFAGGKGLNQSIALARAGAQVFHAGNIGEDGDMLVDLCRGEGIDTRHIRKIPGRTGHAIIQVDKSGQNGIMVYGGANRSNTEAFVDQVLLGFGEGDMLLLQNEINHMDYIMDQAARRQMYIVLNPSPIEESLLASDLSNVALFLLNEVEGAQITWENEPKKILDALRGKYPTAEAVLTLGGSGVVYQKGEERCAQGVYQVEVVDTTAAGDTFTGYFLAQTAEGKAVRTALSVASKAAAIAVSRPGASASIPRIEDVLKAKLARLNSGPNV